MDLTVPVAIASAASLLKSPVQEFLSRISGPAGDEIGQWIRDKIHAFRAENAERALTRAHTILAARGREPREIPLRTLVPLLQGASLENDPSLSEKWAALLAAAADPAVAETILPSFPRFLEFLSPPDAAFLDLLYANKRIGGMFTTPSGQEIDRSWTLKIEVLSSLNFSVDQFDLSFSNLDALGLVLVGGRAFGSTKMEFHDKREVGLTTLGTAFMKACTADADSETPSTAG